ncbi:flagellar biosynthesis protein FlhF [Agaribacter marinus]|uniref:Flagellar biosynthesis protein FlhF n=1 Tax=Agaribacter marinus TaxID=1431249 RepID=A0AA37WI93_9ALTE|nr:flagellar biosynthesis protein FlhF [Agaribacter marinus]GLR70713.1 flagellar biosynthesis regulator FlhF [Agaribacter marinus]
MKIRRFFGKDMREALKQVKDELGGDAVIMSNKKMANGVELVAAVDPSSANPDPAPPVTAKPSFSEIIGNEENDSLRALLERQTSEHQASARPAASHTQTMAKQVKTSNKETADFRSYNTSTVKTGAGNKSFSKAETPVNDQNVFTVDTEMQGRQRREQLRADESMVRSPAFADIDTNEDFGNTQAANLTPPPSVLEPEQLDNIRAELESIKNVLKFQVSELSEERKRKNNPVHHYLHEQLSGMGVSENLCQQFINFLPHKIDEKDGWKYLLNLLSNRLAVGGNDILNQAGVVALVGPTGTGKTTTLAKLAAKYAQKYGADQVALVTIDTYRIAAYEQLATYGRIIGCNVKKAQNAEELNQILYQMRNKRLVLIDTAGFSQRDARLIEQLKQYENGLSVDIKKYLVLPAGAQYRVLNETVKTYHDTDIRGCIFSKLDECYSLGEALSVVIENDLSLSYVTDGQRVPEDIKLADSGNLTLVAAKLYKKYGLPQQPRNSIAHAGGL